MAVRRGGLYSVCKPETAFVVAFDPGIGVLPEGELAMPGRAWNSHFLK